MKSRLKQRICALSLLAWTAVCPADAQQTRSHCEAMVRDGFHHPTPFEIETALAFWYFREKQCDIVVLETGMGLSLIHISSTDGSITEYVCVYGNSGRNQGRRYVTLSLIHI